MIGSGSLVSSPTYVSGRELIMALMSVRMVYNSVLERRALPSTFFKGTFTDLTILSHQPPLHGDISAINCHLMPQEASSFATRF